MKKNAIRKAIDNIEKYSLEKVCKKYLACEDSNEFTYELFNENDTIIVRSRNGIDNKIYQHMSKFRDENKDVTMLNIIPDALLFHKHEKAGIEHTYIRNTMTCETYTPGASHAQTFIRIIDMLVLNAQEIADPSNIVLYIDHVLDFCEALSHTQSGTYAIVLNLIERCKKIVVMDNTMTPVVNALLMSRLKKKKQATLYIDNNPEF